MNSYGTVADRFVAIGTLVLAAVAVFQETIRGWFYHPAFHVSINTEPPDCVAVPLAFADGKVAVDSIYLRLWVENIGNATAKNVEIYANGLKRKRADGTYERVPTFPPMNLKWANLVPRTMYFPGIAPKMGKHCDVGHIIDPSRRDNIPEEIPKLELTDKQTSLTFDLISSPNHKGHIIGPGEYRLEVFVAAENARPITRTIAISPRGTWDADETKMLRDGVGVSIWEA
jgi:hypothetical protein